MLRIFATTLLLLGLCAQSASAAWLAPADLSAGQAPSLAVARDGTAFAAFERSDGANTRVAVAMRAPGGTAFGPAQDLSAAGRDAFSPVVAVDRQGNATLAWMQGPGFVVHARSRPAGADWGEITPALSAGPISRGPALAVGDDGAAIVAWSRGIQVEAAVRRAGAFGPALPVSPATGSGICQAPRAAMDAAGNAAVIWTRRTSAAGDYHVESALKAAGAAAFGVVEPRSTTPGNSDCNTDIQMTPDGRATAVWDFAETGKPSFVAIEDHGPGGWSGAAKISTLANRSIRPVLALGESGDAAAAWISAGQVVAGARPFAALKPLSGATELSGLAIGASPAGDAQAVFVGTSNGSDALFAARRPFDAVLPVALTAPGVSLDSPDVALDDEGNAFAVWVQKAGAASSVQVAAFDAVAPVLGTVEVPASAVAGAPVAMAAAATDRMTAPALQFDFGDGSSADGGAVQHVYAAAGAYTVTVSATDAAGNRVSATRAIQVAPAPVTQGGGPRGPQRLIAVASASWDRLRDGRTRMLELAVNELEGPETVRLACRGKGCRKQASRTVTRHRRTVSFTKAVRGMVLHPKAKLTVTASRPGYITRIITFTMVRGKNPKKLVRCLPPGAKKPRPC